MTEKEWLEGNQLSIDIYNKKYRWNNETFGEFLKRVSGGDEDVQRLILDKKFIFGGRILANRGLVDRKVTYSNCFVLSPPEDNLESIFDCASKMARTFSAGGGVGIDVSKLRPNGSITHNAAKHSTGPVSFMDLYSMVTQIISQNGRRGATMISMDVRHPDILEFIDCKTDLERVKYANISVRVTDDFMQAVEENKDYVLRWPCDSAVDNMDLENAEYGKLVLKDGMYLKVVRARDVFNKLVTNNYDYAEPGILYWDNIENYNLVNNDSSCKYAGVNPCRPMCRALRKLNVIIDCELLESAS